MASIETIRGKRATRYRAIVHSKLRTGPKKLTKTFSTKTAAKAWAQETEEKFKSLYGGGIPLAERITLREAVDRYIEKRLPELAVSGRHNYRHHLEWWCDYIGPNRKLASIQPAEISDGRDLLAENVSNSTANHYLVSLASLFKVAVKRWGWMKAEASPMMSVAKLPGSKERTRFLDDKTELPQLLAACKRSESKYLYTMVMLSITTGARQSEIRWLDWKQVDLKHRVILLENTKNDDDRSMAIVDEVYVLLKDLREADGSVKLNGLLFPGAVSPNLPINVRQSFAVACKRAGVKDFRWHDLRHTCASYLAKSGCSLLEIGAVLGHRSQQTTKKYAHLAKQHQHDLVHQTMGAVFGCIDDD